MRLALVPRPSEFFVLFTQAGGLALMVAGFMLAPHIGGRSAAVTTAGGVLFLLGALSFVINMWRTFDLADARQRLRAAAAERSRVLKTVDD